MSTPITSKSSSIASRLKSFGALHAALSSFSGEVAAELDHRLATHAVRAATSHPASRAAGSAAYRETFAHLSRELKAAQRAMISAHSSHLGQLARVVDSRARRDTLKRALYRRLSRVRRIVETLYGSANAFPVLAISGDTPRAPTALVAQVRETAGFLRKSGGKLLAPDVDGIQVDPSAVAAQLAADADELAEALVDVDEALKEAEITRQAKNTALDAYDRKFLRVGRMAESLCHFAGMPELAKRVRPSSRRPGRRLGDEGSESAPDALPAPEASSLSARMMLPTSSARGAPSLETSSRSPPMQEQMFRRWRRQHPAPLGYHRRHNGDQGSRSRSRPDPRPDRRR